MFTDVAEVSDVQRKRRSVFKSKKVKTVVFSTITDFEITSVFRKRRRDEKIRPRRLRRQNWCPASVTEKDDGMISKDENDVICFKGSVPVAHDKVRYYGW